MTERLLAATVRHPLGAPPHLAGHEYIGDVAAVVRLEIATDDGSYFLLRFGKQGELVGETWHANLEDAQRQAKLEYEHTAWERIES